MVDATQRHVLILVPIVVVDMPRSTRPPLAGDLRWEVTTPIPVHHNSLAYGEGRRSRRRCRCRLHRRRRRRIHLSRLRIRLSVALLYVRSGGSCCCTLCSVHACLLAGLLLAKHRSCCLDPALIRGCLSVARRPRIL